MITPENSWQSCEHAWVLKFLVMLMRRYMTGFSLSLSPAPSIYVPVVGRRTPTGVLDLRFPHGVGQYQQASMCCQMTCLNQNRVKLWNWIQSTSTFLAQLPAHLWLFTQNIPSNEILEGCQKKTTAAWYSATPITTSLLSGGHLKGLTKSHFCHKQTPPLGDHRR